MLIPPREISESLILPAMTAGKFMRPERKPAENISRPLRMSVKLKLWSV